MNTVSSQAAASASNDPVVLTAEALIAQAKEATGLHDFGVESFREGLDVLIEMYEAARLTPQGRRSTRRRLVSLLSNRLSIERAFRKYPEIRARAITKPVYLTGLPRTGTSALVNLLGIDPKSRPLLFWEGRHPDPSDPPGLAGESDPRFIALRDAIERGRQRNPEFAKIHDVKIDGPEECVELLAHSMSSVMMGIEPLLAPYDAWFQAQDLRPQYAYYRDLLKMIDWQRPGDRWLLKSPCHLWALDILVEMFPDACIIQTHRKPVEIIGSYCSMMAALMNVREPFDLQTLGPAVLEYLSRSVERAMDARDVSDPRRFIDVRYQDFLGDPMGTVERIYDAFGLELGGAAADGMAAHVRSHPQNKHGRHEYTLSQYGLTHDAVNTRLARYIQRFDL